MGGRPPSLLVFRLDGDNTALVLVLEIASGFGHVSASHQVAGVKVDDLRDQRNQIWPFANSLMIAFTARWPGGDTVLAMQANAGFL